MRRRPTEANWNVIEIGRDRKFERKVLNKVFLWFPERGIFYSAAVAAEEDAVAEGKDAFDINFVWFLHY